MKTRLSYGKSGLEIELPKLANLSILEPRFQPGLTDINGSLTDALHRPINSPSLRELVNPGMKVGIVFSDITRPTPNHLLIPAVLREIRAIPDIRIILFNALGTHRQNTEVELRTMLGDEIVNQYPIVQNNAFDPLTQMNVGTTSRGHEVWLNREFMQCDLRILTGFIEPHFFAGFSGGGKAVMPGMAGQITVLGNHDAANIGHPNATWGITNGNPIWEEVQEALLCASPTFLLNVALNREKEIIAIFAGNSQKAHAAGCEFVKKTAMLPVKHAYDIVITSNSGYPLDLNLYQAVKGMSAAAQVVKPGGAIIIAAECWDGIPEHGLYGQLLRGSKDPQELLEKITSPGFLKQDQWQAQIQALTQLKADVFVYSHYLQDEQIRACLLNPCRNIEVMLKKLIEKYGPNTSACVLPEGPQTIPYINM